MMRSRSRQVWAFVGLGLLLLAGAALVRAALTALPAALIEVALLILAIASTWYAVVHRGALRVAYGFGTAVLIVAAVLVHDDRDARIAGLAAIGLLALAALAARVALRPRLHLPAAEPPRHAVLFFNPLSGGGKALEFDLADEARSRGIQPIELTGDADLVSLVRAAVADGADGLMAAGGDGTQAAVAAIAAEHDIPFACVPAGTRNHFALDLGVDRDDVVGSLDAFVHGGEKVVDLADVNGRVFVNNVSLGLYAEAVARPGYRRRKVATLLAAAPDVLADEPGSATDLTWTGPDGAEQTSAAVILISNNAYRLGLRLGTGTRPRLDDGTLGIAVVGALTVESGDRRLITEWTQPQFVVHADADVPVGIDGESVHMASPIVVRSRPRALRVRISAHHPGASPSSTLPPSPWGLVPALWRVARGRRPATWPT